MVPIKKEGNSGCASSMAKNPELDIFLM